MGYGLAYYSEALNWVGEIPRRLVCFKARLSLNIRLHEFKEEFVHWSHFENRD